VYVGRVFGSKGGLDYESVWLIWLVALCRALTVMQAARFKRLSFDPFPLLKWSGKFGQRAKMYPTRTNGYENDKATEFFRPV
jgi:hypothetical protein